MHTKENHRARSARRTWPPESRDERSDVFDDAPIGLVRVARGQVQLNLEGQRLLELFDTAVPSFAMWLDAFFGAEVDRGRALLDADRRAGTSREHETEVQTTSGVKRIAWRVRENPRPGADFPAPTLEQASLTWTLREVEATVDAVSHDATSERPSPVGGLRRDRNLRARGRGSRHLGTTARLHALRPRCVDEAALLAEATEVIAQAWDAVAVCVMRLDPGSEVLACTRREGGCEAAHCRSANLAGLESGRGPSGPSSVGRAIVMTGVSGTPSVSLTLELADEQRMLLSIEGPFASRPVDERAAILREDLAELEEVGRVLVDIIDAERTNQRLRERDSELRSIFAALSDMVTVVDAAGTILSFHGGQGPSQRRSHPLVGRPLTALMPSQVAALAIAATRRAIATLEVQELTYAVDGRHYFARGMAFGEPARVLWLAREVTDERRMQDRLLAVQRYEGLAIFTSALAHDFSNLITGVLGNAELAREEVEPTSTAAEALNDAIHAARRASELCHQLAEMSGQAHLRLGFINVSELAEEMLVVLRTSIDQTVEVVRDVLPPEATPLAIGDPTQVRQVILNLLINAKNALDVRGGRVTVRTGIDGGAVFVEVGDDGRDLGPEARDFGFTPASSGRLDARRLGLAAAAGIVGAHGGALVVESEPGGGTTVRFTLPTEAEAGSA